MLDVEPIPILERKQGHWPGMFTLFYTYKIYVNCFEIGLPLLDDQLNRRRDSLITAKKRSSAVSQRQKTSASIVTQKTTLPQIETIAQRDQVYQVRFFLFLNYKFILFILAI